MDPPNAFVNAIVGFKNKWNKIDVEKLKCDLSNESKWDDFENFLQNLIFAIQALCILSIHGKLHKRVKILENTYFSGLSDEDLQ